MGSDCCTGILVPYQYGFGLLHQYIGPLPVKGRKGHQYYWSLPVKGHNVHQYQSRPVVLASTDVSPHPGPILPINILALPVWVGIVETVYWSPTNRPEYSPVYWPLPGKGQNVHQYQSRPVVLASTDVGPQPAALTLGGKYLVELIKCYNLIY